MAFLEYTPTQTLFQYCSPDGFVGIVKSQRLWFSDLASSNDPRELRLGYEHFIEALRSVRHNEYRGERGQFLSVLAGRLARYVENVQAFSCCLSLAEDELPMWGAYGSNYSGVAIGFRATAVSDMPIRVQKVRYVSDDTAEAFEQLVLDIARAFETTHAPDDLNYWIPATASAFATMTALKHRTWGYEREIRLVHVQPKRPPDDGDDIFSVMSALPDGAEVRWTKSHERLNGARTVSYLEFPFGRFRNKTFDPSRAIEKVIIGPNCPLTTDDVTAAMKDNGFHNFEVAKSVCEIR
jgi:hypothetical protein